MKPDMSDADYRSLAEFRYEIRRFLRFSEQAAREAGLEPQQHQLLLALRGLPEESRPTISELAERLQIQHHSMVELVDRLSNRGLVLRKRAGEDRREVLIHLTPKGNKLLRDLAGAHREELLSVAPELVAALRKLATAGKRGGAEGAARRPRTLRAVS